MNFPADVVRLIATHLDGKDKSNKADVANLAATCQAWRRYLAHHVERHRLIFTRLTQDEMKLTIEHNNACLEADWTR